VQEKTVNNLCFYYRILRLKLKCKSERITLYGVCTRELNEVSSIKLSTLYILGW